MSLTGGGITAQNVNDYLSSPQSRVPTQNQNTNSTLDLNNLDLSNFNAQTAQEVVNQIKDFSVKESNVPLPFQYLTTKIPEVLGNVAQKGVELLGGSNINVSNPELEIHKQETIGGQRFSKNFITGSNEKLTSYTNKVINATASIGQYAIPYLGEALFLGALAEKPLLRPQEFKQEFLANPIKMGVLYSLGLVSVVGGISSALSRAEQVALKEAVRNAKTSFVAVADDQTLQVLARTTINGKPIISLGEIKNILEEGDKMAGQGIQYKFKELNPKELEVLKDKITIVAQKVPGIVKNVRTISGEGGSLVVKSPLESFSGFRSISKTEELEQAIIKAKKFNINKPFVQQLQERLEYIKKLDNVPTKRDITGIISPTEAEDMFKVYSGNTKLRIYKDGSTSYVFNPDTDGLLKIVPRLGDSLSGKTILLTEIKRAQQLGGLSSSLAKNLLAKEINTKILPLIEKAEQKAVTSLAVSKRSLEIAKPLGTTKLISAQKVEPKTAFSTGAYAGQGTYERTNEVAINWNKPVGSLGSNSRATTKSITKQKTEFKDLTETKTIPLTKLSVNQTPKQETTPNIKLRTNQIPNQQSRYAFGSTAKPRLGTPTKTEIKPKITPKSSVLIIGSGSSKKKSEFKDLRRSGFAPVVKINGKFQRIGKESFANAKQALGSGEERVFNDLTRSVGVVRTSGEKILNSSRAQASYNKLSSGFRPSKRYSGIIVQKNALSNKQETTLIQAFRRQKVTGSFR